MGKKRVLLVQCCNLPQFFFLLEKLKLEHPDWKIEALVREHTDVRFYLRHFETDVKAHFFEPGRDLRKALDGFDAILFPLLNRGYRRIKRAAADIPADQLEIDYESRTSPLERRRMRHSMVRPLHPPSREFLEYAESFPHHPLGEKVLVVESAHPDQAARAEESWRRLAAEGVQITRVSYPELRRARKELSRRQFDSAVVYFTGEKGYFRLKLLPFLLGIPRILVVNESGGYFYANRRSLPRFVASRLVGGIDYTVPAPRILLVQTESAGYTRAVLEELKQVPHFRNLRVQLLCRSEDREEFEDEPCVESMLSPAKATPLEAVRLWKKIRRFDPDINAGCFTGRPVFRFYKWIYFAAGSRRHLVFNAELNHYWMTPRNVFRIRRFDGVRSDLAPDGEVSIALFQTEIGDYTEAVHSRLNQPDFFSRPRFLVVGRHEEVPRFRRLEGVREVVGYRPNHRLGDAFRIWMQIVRLRPRVVSAVFSGRPVYRPAKLLFLLSPVRRRLVFNASLDAYWLTLKTVPRLFRREPLLFDQEHTRRHVLFIETAAPELVNRALSVAALPRVIPGGRFTVYCHEDRAELYRRQPGVEDVVTYSRTRPVEDFLKVWQLIRSRPQVVAAIFSGRRIFMKQKLLFWLVPARSRLAFNERIDCFYVNLRSLPLLLKRGSRSSSGIVSSTLVGFLKILLFLPRFGYLLAWKALQASKR